MFVMKTWQKLAYSFGSLGSALSANAVQSYVVFYYADVLKLPIHLIGYVWIAYGIWNAINDPLFGYLSDRTRTRWGRRIPYVALGSIPLALAFVLLWAPPLSVREGGDMGLLAYFAAMVFLFDGIYTLVILNWTALFPEMFPSLRDRSVVSMWRQVFGNIGLIIGIALAPMVYEAFGWTVMGLVFGALTAVALVVSLFGSRELGRRVDGEPLNVLPAIGRTVANRSFLTYVIPCTLVELTFGLLMATMPFYSKYVLRIAGQQSTMLLGAVFAVVFATIALWMRHTVTVGPKRAMSNAIVVFAAALVPFGLARTFGAGVAGGAFLGVGLAGLMLLFDVLLADVIDEDELRTGRRREGMYFGANALFIRLGESVKALVLSTVLRASGYDPSLAVQPTSVVTGIRLLVTGIPVLALLLALIVLSMYPLHGEGLARIKRELAARRGSGPGGPGPEPLEP